MPTTGTDYKAQVLTATDIVELIGQSVALKRRGRSYVGLCPFHQEKTGSFHVHPDRQFFHCFGCKASGNAIDFVMKRDRIEFLDALKLLGQRAGIEMPQYGVSKQKTGERQTLLEAHSAACALFEKLLSHPTDGLPARTYLQKRGFNQESVKRFQVGLAADSWDTLLDALSNKYPPQVLHQAGLVKARENGSGHYDTFRNRLMFPIRDAASQIIAFGGRVMPGSEDPAKYLNSPETPLFSKSKCVFGLDLAKQKITETRTVVIVEGYTDVIMAHQYGVSNVVSILGTAFTDDHVKLLKRWADKIVLLFDADTAGDTAADKALSVILTQPIDIGIAAMPAGADPDEYLMEHGAEGFQQLLDNATDALTYKWRQLQTRFQANETNLTGQEKAVEEYLATLSTMAGHVSSDDPKWGLALSRVVKLTGVPITELHKRLRKRTTTKRYQVSKDAEPTKEVRGTKALTARERAERQILGGLLVEPQRWHQLQQVVHLQDFTDTDCHKLAETFWDFQRNEGEPSFSEFLGVLPDENQKELAVEIFEMVEDLNDVSRTLDGALAYLAKEKREQELRQMQAELNRTGEVDPLKRIQELRQAEKRKLA